MYLGNLWEGGGGGGLRQGRQRAWVAVHAAHASARGVANGARVHRAGGGTLGQGGRSSPWIHERHGTGFFFSLE